MKSLFQHLFFICIALFAVVTTQGQITYGHEWINFSHGNPHFKIKIAEDGVYRIDYLTLSTGMASSGVNINQLDPRDFQLFHNGEQIPIYIFGEANGQFNTSDYIEFVGRKNDGSLDTELYKTPSDQPNKYYSNFNDTSAYFLTWDGTAGAQHLRFKEEANDLTNLPPKEDYFMHTLVQEYHNAWHGGKSYYVSGIYLYDSRFETGEGYMLSPFNKSSTTRNITVDNIYAGGPSVARVRTNVISIFDQQHRTRFSLNGNVVFDSVYGNALNGEYVTLFDRSVPISYFNNTGQSDEFKYEALGTGSSDRQSIGYIEIEYPRNFNAGGDSQFAFTLTGSAGSDKYLEITNFNNQGQNPVLYDLENRQRLVGNMVGGTARFKLPMNVSSTELFLYSVPEIADVSELEAVNFIDFSSPSNQGDYLLISGERLREDGQGNDWITQYQLYRASVEGGDWEVLNVNSELLYDQFAYGVTKHPLSLRRFVQFALDSFLVQPEHVFLIGKSLEYNLARTDPNRYGLNMVPTFGEPGSDMLMTTRGFGVSPHISIGRLAARSGSDVQIYLDKVRALEQNQRALSYSITDRAWMKRILHFGGGNVASEQNYFKQLLGDYEQLISNRYYGGHVHSFFKTSPDPIQYLQSKFIDSLINDGVSLITFFGHSTSNSFDVNIDNPANYDNYGKYPMIISNGCFSGQIHATGKGISEDFIFEQDKGAIAFLASTSYAAVSSLNAYTGKFYEYLARDHYNEEIGNVIRSTCDFLSNSASSNDILRLLIENNTLHGDPAVILNTHEDPDYAIEEATVIFEPEDVSVDLDSFTVSVEVLNLGKAIQEELTIEIQRVLSDGSLSIQSKTISAPYFSDTVRFNFYTDPIAGVNDNIFTIELDPEVKLSEKSRINNVVTKSLFIKSNEAFPVYPYDLSIVNSPSVTLKASTSLGLSSQQRFRFEVDTTLTFNSPLIRSNAVESNGGVVEWSEPPVNWENEVVYYWRVSPDFDDPDSAKWNSSSFVYVENHPPGWNQSHYFQFVPNYMANVNLTPQRRFKFVDDLKEVKVTNGVYTNTFWQDVATYYINSERVSSWSCIGKGLIIAVIDSVTGLPWSDRDYSYGETHCLYSQRQAFHFRTSNLSQRTNVINFLDDIPNGNYVLAMSFQGYEYKQYASDSLSIGTSILHKLTDMGADGLLKIDTFSSTPPFIFFVKKGQSSSATTLVGNGSQAYLDTSFTISGLWNQGYINSSFVGVAKSFDRVIWEVDEVDSTDYVDLDVFGVKNDGTKERVIDHVISRDTSIQGISAALYPNLEVRLNVRDDSMRSVSQLRKWRVTYDPVGDIAIRPDILFDFHSDTLQQGEQLRLSVAAENITDYDMDSVLVSIYLLSADNVREDLLSRRFKPMLSGDTIQIHFEMDTKGYSGENMLVVEVNPHNDQPEQYRFNNILSLPFVVEKDLRNPLLDVTFDGVHIMDGDIVSSKPKISVELKDENTYLILNDTSLMDLFILDPMGFRKRVSYSSEIIEFVPADSNGENEARVYMSPEFTKDGLYQLIIRARDKTGNYAGVVDYRISFEVITRNAISNVLNYPNPFTSSTQFVFTITGSAVPDYLKVQIMTVSGKIVREVTKEELGPLHVGTNLTEFRWDGTDQYGDPLANGLYFYRVVARLDGQEMMHFQINGVDRYFESGLGKMYLAR